MIRHEISKRCTWNAPLQTSWKAKHEHSFLCACRNELGALWSFLCLKEGRRAIELFTEYELDRKIALSMEEANAIGRLVQALDRKVTFIAASV